MSVLRFTTFILTSCYLLLYEASASFGRMKLEGGVSPGWQAKFISLQTSVLNAINDLSHERQRHAQLENRLKRLQTTAAYNSTCAMVEKQTQILLEEQVSTLQKALQDAKWGMAYEKERRSHLEDEFSQEKERRSQLENEFSQERRKRTELERRVNSLQETVRNVNRHLPPKATRDTPFTDCWDLLSRGGFTESGVYYILPAPGYSMLPVWCDMTTDGGGWILLQNRYDGSVNFTQSFERYEKGFGMVGGEHWLGLHWMNVLTSQRVIQMRVDLCGSKGQVGYAVYSNFTVSDQSDTYRLHLGVFMKGSNGDGMAYHVSRIFRTTEGCANRFKGGWWYGPSIPGYTFCYIANLNGGDYFGGKWDGIVWPSFSGSHLDARSSEIKIRPNKAPGDSSRPYVCPS